MEEKIYFYRKLGTELFESSEIEKKIIPVRLKSPYLSRNAIFDSDTNFWTLSENLPPPSADVAFVEFVEYPSRPQNPRCTGYDFLPRKTECTFEDYSPSEMQRFFEYRAAQERYDFNRSQFEDNSGIEKDYFSAFLLCDDEKLTVRLVFTKFDRENERPSTASEISRPAYQTEEFLFDMKNGVFYSSEFEKEQKERYSDRISDSESEIFSSICTFLSTKELSELPKSIIDSAHQKVLDYARKFTGVDIKSTVKDDYIKSVLGITYDRNENFTYSKLVEMYQLVLLPYEPKLSRVIFSNELKDIKFRFRYKRTDSKVLNRFLKKAHLRGNRILRKCFAENPMVLISAMRLHDAKFRDINLYNRVIENQENWERINYFSRKSLVFFSKYSIKRRGEIATLNSLLKAKIDEDYSMFDFDDTLDMFMEYFKHIPQTLRDDILEDGFTKFNHDALSNISYQVKNKNITFKYSNEQMELEDDIDGYEFRLPESSYQLCEIGTALHNCVAGYAKSVEEKRCTIVYARKDGEYALCIEVRENKICQERIKHNGAPDEAQRKILKAWHERHSLVK